MKLTIDMKFKVDHEQFRSRSRINDFGVRNWFRSKCSMSRSGNDESLEMREMKVDRSSTSF